MSLPPQAYHDILNQPNALATVLGYQFADGKQQLKRAAEAILSANRVVIASIGASYAASIPFVYRMAELGIKVILEDAAELLHYNTQLYGQETAFILISRSGDTIEIVKLVQRLKGQGHIIVGVTNVAQSNLGQNCDILLELGSPPDELIAIQTWSATVLVLNLLAEQIAGRLEHPDCQKEFDRAVQAVAVECERYRNLSSEWKTFLQEYRTFYLLGRGASQASACESQLLFHEMAWQAATFYPAGNFRHGPWEVVDQRFIGFVFAPRDVCYALNIGLASDIGRMGGHTLLITPDVPAHLPAQTLACPVAHLTTGLSPLVEIIPIQFFVYEYALWKGHSPGLFRASTPITLTEGEIVLD